MGFAPSLANLEQGRMGAASPRVQILAWGAAAEAVVEGYRRLG